MKQTKRWKERKIGTKELQGKQEKRLTKGQNKNSLINNSFTHKQIKSKDRGTE